MTGDPLISRTAPINPQAIREMQEAISEDEIVVVESEDFAADADFSGMIRIMGQFKELDKLKETPKKGGAEEKKSFTTKDINEMAARYMRNSENELKDTTLLALRSSITDDDEPEEIIAKVFRIYPDHALADDALDFLEKTTELKAVKVARDRFAEEFKTAITAGKNISVEARKFSKEGLGSPTGLRDLYRDILINPREPIKLFEELTDQFRYEKLKTAINFLLHALGADLKAERASIDRVVLSRLLEETRSLQGILGVFRFFQSSMGLIQKRFASYNLVYPSRITFELLGRVFIKILAERYMNGDKVIQVFQPLGLAEEAAAKYIICTQFGRALGQVAPKYYRSKQHKDELHKSIFDAIDKIEEEMEEE
jgi:type III secretion protein W